MPVGTLFAERNNTRVFDICQYPVAGFPAPVMRRWALLTDKMRLFILLLNGRVWSEVAYILLTKLSWV